VVQPTPLTYGGRDVSKASISIALLRADGRLDEERIPNTREAVRSLVRRWAKPATIRACYEAGPTGYALYRELSGLGIDTVGIAPSLMSRRPRRAGEDRPSRGPRRAGEDRPPRRPRPVGLFRGGELMAVRVPTPEDEAVRDLLRPAAPA
jgi:transposase